MRLSAHILVPLLLLTSVYLSFKSVHQTPVVNAAGNLSDPSDVVSTLVGSVDGVGHTIGFTLPREALQILPSDRIFITMPSYSNIQQNALVKGAYTGTPIATVSGQSVKIHGISVLPGHSIIIEGISARNPPSQGEMRLIISVTEDDAGDLIKNIVTVYSSRSNGQVAVTASIAPPYASVRISGSSAPGTFITITENGTVIGTDTSGIAGLFSKYLTGISPGSHTFTVFGVDTSSRTTSLLDTSAIMPIYQETAISGLLLSPTIEINSASIDQADDLITWGTTIINGSLSIFTEPHLRTYYATASATGSWGYTINNTSEYIPGDYHIYSLVQDGAGSQSLFSNALQFTVLSNTSGNGTAPCNISRGDLDCDFSINLVDFSILMYYWGSTNAAADINDDDFVNLTDFSIMMYYWGT